MYRMNDVYKMFDIYFPIHPQLQLQTLLLQLHTQALPSLVLVIVLVLVAVLVIVSWSLLVLVASLVLVLVWSTVGLLVLVVDTVTFVLGDPIPEADIMMGLFLAPTHARPTPIPKIKQKLINLISSIIIISVST